MAAECDDRQKKTMGWRGCQSRVLFINSQSAHFPIIFHFRHIGVREIHGIAYLTVRAVQGYNTNLVAIIRLRRTVFPPVETACRNIAAK